MWTDAATAAPDIHVGFRGTFTLDSDARVDLRLSGASWYVVWIDGEYFTEGPDRYTAAYPEYQLRSVDLKKGKHTTRHSQMIPIDHETYLCDTPGFSSLYTTDMEKEELKNFFPEFHPYEGKCRFLGCIHGKEPGCAVKEALEQGNISKERFENYPIRVEVLSRFKTPKQQKQIMIKDNVVESGTLT